MMPPEDEIRKTHPFIFLTSLTGVSAGRAAAPVIILGTWQRPKKGGASNEETVYYKPAHAGYFRGHLDGAPLEK